MPPDALAPVPEEHMERAKERIPELLRENPDFAGLLFDLTEEIKKDYRFSIRKAIGKEKNACST